MSYNTKKRIKEIEKMNMTAVRKTNASVKKPISYPNKALAFFPLIEEDLGVCQDINHNLFQLEKDLAFFSFAIKEIEDITYSLQFGKEKIKSV